MAETSASLLNQLRIAPDGEAWSRLVALYTPLIHNWLTHLGLPPQDAEDVSQEVLTVLVRRLPEFERQPRTGAFRRWLRTITVNCLRDFWRSRRNQVRATGDSQMQELLQQLTDPDSGLSRQWEIEHDQHVTQQLLDRIRPQVESSTWEAFYRVAIKGEPAGDVADQLGMTINAVYIARTRVLSRLRQQAEGLLD